MEDKGAGREMLNEDKQGRLAYHAPELIKLGPIQSTVQHGVTAGSDGRSATSSFS
jgi:hypothetical protein